MLKFGQQQQQTLSSLVQHQSQLNKQAGGRHQQAIYASTRELYEPTTKLVIGSNGQQQNQQQQLQQSQNLNKLGQQQQQQQARAKFYKERAEDEFYDE